MTLQLHQQFYLPVSLTDIVIVPLELGVRSFI
jgi:hypothetical protein